MKIIAVVASLKTCLQIVSMCNPTKLLLTETEIKTLIVKTHFLTVHVNIWIGSSLAKFDTWIFKRDLEMQIFDANAGKPS
jgi:hypothetical protein